MNPFKFASDIAQKLGLTTKVTGELVPTELRRDVGLGTQRTAHRIGLQGGKANEQPTGYARSIRRARHRDVDSQRAKARKRAMRKQQERADFVDTAGPLADIYLNGSISGRPVGDNVRKRVTERVHNQAWAMVAAENLADPKANLTFAAALKTIEGHLMSNLDIYRKQQAEREEADLRFRLTTKRGQDEVRRRAAADELTRELRDYDLGGRIPTGVQQVRG